MPRNGDVGRAPRDFVARGSLPWTSRRLKESAASGCRVDEASLQLRSLTSSTLCSGGVVRCRPTYDVVVDKVAVSLSLPRPPCDPTSRAAKPTVGRCCRRVVNRLPEPPYATLDVALQVAVFPLAFSVAAVFFCQLLTWLSSNRLPSIDSLLIVDNNDLILFPRQHFVE